MRKWTYLVAALLMSGATATFTSCIDTEEPAGITELRGAKAELLRAKAAFEIALANKKQADADLQQVKVEREKIELEIDKLRQEMIAAENAWKQDSLQARRDTLAASLEIKLIEMQEQKANADYDLQEAIEKINAALITMKDDIYSRKISYYKALLVGGDYINEDGVLVPIGGNGASKDLATAETALFQLENQKVQFIAENQFFQANLEASLAKQQKVLEIQQGLRDDLDKLNAVDVADLNAQLVAKTNEQKALDTKEGEAIKNLVALRAELQPTDEQLAELDKQKQAKKTYTIAVADIADASMYGLLKAALSGFSYGSVETTDLNYVFSTDPATGEVTMDNDYTLYGNGYSLANEGNILNALATRIKTNYQNEFTTAYNSLFTSSESPSNLFNNADGSLKDNVIAKVDNELDRLEIDLPNKKAAATTDSTAWVNAYAAYQAALVAYGDYQGSTTWNAIVKQIAEYNDLPATTTAAAKAVSAETLRKAIIDYLNKREAVDGFVYTPDFRETYNTAFAETTDLTAFNAEMVNYESSSSIYLGASVISTTVTSLASASDKNLLAVFLKAANKVFGGTNNNLNNAVQPEAYKDGETTKYRMPAGYEPTNGTYGAYLAAKDADDIFSTIDEWIALYQGIDADAKASAKEVADIDAQEEALTIAAMEQYSALWQAEVEAYLIKGSNTARSFEIWSTNNPYRNIYTSGTGATVLSEYDAIQQEINYINSAILGGGTFEYVIYDPTTGEYSTTSGTLTAAINDLDQDIEDAQEDIVDTQTKIDLYKEFGFTGTNIGSATKNDCLKLIEKEIAEKQAEVNLLQAEVTRIQTTMQKLLDAYTAGSETPAE